MSPGDDATGHGIVLQAHRTDLLPVLSCLPIGFFPRCFFLRLKSRIEGQLPCPLLHLKGGDAMILICDTRQQEGKHKNIEAYCNRMGIEMIRQKCEVGDYMFPNGKIAVDTKQDL